MALTIGLPRSLLYHRYRVLWKAFFDGIGIETVESPPSNRAILDRGIRLAVDETCLPLKLLVGHVDTLKDRVDFVLMPRIVSVAKGETACVKFLGAYDVVRNVVEGVELMEYNVDVSQGVTERAELCRVGRELRAGRLGAWRAYGRAKRSENAFLEERTRLQEAALALDGLKVLVVGHGYNIDDELLGMPVVRALESLGVIPIAAEMHDRELLRQLSGKLSSDIPWTYNKELLGAVQRYRDRVDGIIFLVTFPCGPDSLMTELCVRKIKDTPILVIVLDELQGEAGLRTRIESFVDLIEFRRVRGRAQTNLRSQV